MPIASGVRRLRAKPDRIYPDPPVGDRIPRRLDPVIDPKTQPDLTQAIASNVRLPISAAVFGTFITPIYGSSKFLINFFVTEIRSFPVFIKSEPILLTIRQRVDSDTLQWRSRTKFRQLSLQYWCGQCAVRYLNSSKGFSGWLKEAIASLRVFVRCSQIRRAVREWARK